MIFYRSLAKGATMSRPVRKPLKPNTKQIQENPSKEKTKKVLISFLSYDQDSWKVKKKDESFMKSFYPDDPQRTPQSADEIWRPSVALAQLFELAEDYYPEGSSTPTANGYEDLVFDEYYLLCDDLDGHIPIKKEIVNAIENIKPHVTKLYVENPRIENAFNTTDVYQKLFAYLSQDKFHKADTQYYVNCTSGTTQIRNCLFYFTQTGLINALRIEPTPWLYHKQRNRPKGTIYPKDGRRWNRGSYVIDDPKDFGQAYATIDEKEADGYLKILRKGVITKDLSNLEEIADVIECINNITETEFKATQTILITGETGVGKTQLAKNIAKAFGVENNFISVNCATIRGADPNIQRIELFGCKKNAASGIDEAKEGALKKADGGLLFLDEIGELSLEMQAMFLTALDTRTFIPLGGNYANPERSSFLLICGTNRPLEKAVESGTFRRDLYNRINAWHFELPPLREHLDDIKENLKIMVGQIGKKCGKKSLYMLPEAEKTFLEFSKTISWDGNFRELNAMITRMVILSNGNSITEDIVKKEIDAAKKRYARKQECSQNNQLIVQASRHQETDAPSAATANNEDPQSPVGVPVIDSKIYKKIRDSLSPVKKAELDVLIKLIQDENMKTQSEVCQKIYGDKLSANGGLSKYLEKHFGLQFKHGRLEPKKKRTKC